MRSVVVIILVFSSIGIRAHATEKTIKIDSLLIARKVFGELCEKGKSIDGCVGLGRAMKYVCEIEKSKVRGGSKALTECIQFRYTVLKSATELTKRACNDGAENGCLDYLIDENQYIRIVKALVESGKWAVVDRGFGFHAVKQEQERLHRSESDRYADKEKWAHWSKLFGVGAIVVANAQCQVRETWIFRAMYYYCEQFLTLVDSNTAEVLAAIESSGSGPSGNSQGAVRSVSLPPSWDGAVEKLVTAYPKYFDSPEYHERLKKYQEESRQLAEEQKKSSLK